MSRLGTHHDQIGSNNAALSSQAILSKMAKGSSFNGNDMLGDLKDLMPETDSDEVEDDEDVNPDEDVDPDDSISNVGSTTRSNGPPSKKQKKEKWWDKTRVVEIAEKGMKDKTLALRKTYDDVKASVGRVQKDMPSTSSSNSLLTLNH